MAEYLFDITRDCNIVPLNDTLASLPFVCGNSQGEEDLNEFFHNQAMLFAKERLGKTYCVVTDAPTTTIVAFFTVSNDSVKTTFIPKQAVNKIERKIPGRKHLHTYPAVLIGRLGVSKEYQGRRFMIGQQVINYIKQWFVEEDNKTGCRFLVVDAYNHEDVLKFYERNRFKYLYADEEIERQEQHISEDEDTLRTRHMFLDLLHTEILQMPKNDEIKEDK